MDWNTFTKKTLVLAQKPSLQLKDIEDYLAFCKEKMVVFSRMQRFFLQMGLLKTEFGRNLFLKSVFKTLKEHIPFAEAPQSAVEAYDTLIEKLFSASIAQELEIPIETKAAPQSIFEELETLRSKSKRFQDIQKELTSLYEKLKKWRVSNGSQDEFKGLSQKLFEIKNVYEERAHEIQELAQMYRDISIRAAKLNFEEKLSSEWNDHIEHVKKLQSASFILPEFHTESDFMAWRQDEKKKIDKHTKILQQLQQGIQASQKLNTALQDIASVRKALFEPYGIQYIEQIQKDLRTGKREATDALFQELSSHTKQVIALEHEIQKRYKDLQRKAIPLYEDLYHPDLSLFEDLPKTLNVLLAVDPDTLPEKLGPEIPETLDRFFQQQYQKAEKIVQVGQERKKKLDEIVEFQKLYFNELQFCSLYADLQKRKEEIEKEIASLTLSKEIFQKQESSQIDSAIQKMYERYLNMKEKAKDVLLSLENEARNLEAAKILAVHTIKRRLFEIFTSITPYADLQTKIQKLRSVACKYMENLDDQFYSGKITISDYRQGCFELAYEHDIMQLRADLSFRATRLRELREESHRLLEKVQQDRRLLDLLSFSKDQDIYKELLLVQEELFRFLHFIENPFQIFSKSEEFESVNTIFRKLWIELESLQPKVQTVTSVIDLYLKESAPRIQREFVRFLDDVEEVLKVDNKRPQLVHAFDVRMKERASDPWRSLQEECVRVEKTYPFVQPFSFFISLPDRSRRNLLAQSKKTYEDVQHALSFAKDLQYIKTFEEERVDDILEAFERVSFIEDTNQNELISAWNAYVQRMEKSCKLVEEEVLFDVGLLDMKALYDVEVRRLKKTLLLAIEKADSFLHSNAVQTVEQESAQLLQQLGSLCHLLFKQKIGREKNNPIALKALFINGSRNLLLQGEEYIQQERKKTNKFLANPWIEEFHSLRKEAEKLELYDDDLNGMLEIYTNICTQLDAIDELKRASFLDAHKKELLQLLDQIKTLPKEQYPLFSIPGYLDYFAITK